MSELENKLKQFCENNWLKQMLVDEAKSKLTIVFRYKSYSVPFSLNFLDIVREIRFSGLVYPIEKNAPLGFIREESGNKTIVLAIGEVVTLDMVQKNYENGKDAVFVAVNNSEYVLKRERV